MSQPHDHWSFAVDGNCLRITCPCAGSEPVLLPFAHVRDIRRELSVGGWVLVFARASSVVRLRYLTELDCCNAFARVSELMRQAGWVRKPVETFTLTCTDHT